jgi:hypothetical protein
MSEMRLFRWSSEYLANYRKGYIVAMAGTLEEARRLATENFDKYDRQRFEYDYYEGFGGEENIADRLNVFLKDIEKDPEIVDPSVLFLSGSE